MFNESANNIYSSAASYHAPVAINFNAAETTTFAEAHNTYSVTKTETSRKRSLGGTKTKSFGSSSYSAISIGDKFKTARLNIKSGLKNTITNAEIDADKTISEAPVTEVKLGTNYASFSSYGSKSNAFWQRMYQHSEQHNTFTSGKIRGEFNATGQLILEQIRGEALEYLYAIIANTTSV